MVSICETPETEWDDEYIICPYCGERSGDCFEWVTSEYPTEMTCDVCGGVFTYEASYQVTYIARPVRPPADREPEAEIIAECVVLDALSGMAGDLGNGLADVADAAVTVIGGAGEVAGAVVEGAAEVVGSVVEGVLSLFDDL